MRFCMLTMLNLDVADDAVDEGCDDDDDDDDENNDEDKGKAKIFVR